MKLLSIATSALAFFAQGDFNDFTDALKDLMNRIAGPLIGVTSGAALLLGLWMGWTFWSSAGDETKRKKAKDQLKYFILGLIMIFVVAAAVPLILAAMQTWAQDYQ